MFLDVSRIVWRALNNQLPTGIDRACLAYIAHYRENALAVIQRGGITHILGKKASIELYVLLLNSPTQFRRHLISLLARSIMTVEKPLRDTARPLYLNVSHTGLDRGGHACWVRRKGVEAVYFVHDLIPITHPQYVMPGVMEQHVERMRVVLRHARGIIANSEYSVETLTRFARWEKLALPPYIIAPLGITPLMRGGGHSAPISAPYFVILGTIEGRKNHLLLFRVWRKLIESLGDAAPKLIVIGKRGWCADAVFEQLDNDLALRGHVIELQSCDDDMLAVYLAHARALLFPTFVEGQGLPLTEALAAGTPVIASNLTVFKETARDIPDYLDPNDAAAWERAVLDYMDTESPSRAMQIVRMAGFAPLTWAEHFVMVDGWLAEQGLLS